MHGKLASFLSGDVLVIIAEKKRLDLSGTAGEHWFSRPITTCQICNNKQLKNILFLGYIPPVNTLHEIGSVPKQHITFPLELLFCSQCSLVQIGVDVDQSILFPLEYPYLSGNTKILRDNFSELYIESLNLLELQSQDLIIDIGSNDGTLLSNFFQKGHPVLGIEPTLASNVALCKGIPTLRAFFNPQIASEVWKQYGPAKVITATNVFAHISDIHDVIESIKLLLSEDGVFISESHYLVKLIETLQYDTVYHEHLRYYTLTSLASLFNAHDMEIFHAKSIATHGGSIRVYAAKKGQREMLSSVENLLNHERTSGIIDGTAFKQFSQNVVASKLELLTLLAGLKKEGKKIVAIGSPSRSSTLVNYVGLDNNIIDCVYEVSTSFKLNKYIPGTRIPIVDECGLYTAQPDFALLFSWHIADEIIENLRMKSYRGKFIIPLPSPRIVD